MQRLNQVLKEYKLGWEGRCEFLGEFFALKPNAVSIAINYELPKDISFDFLELDEAWIRARVRKYLDKLEKEAKEAKAKPVKAPIINQKKLFD
jgi:basic membrane lipoprotein Med (substrate-binding protein (PBP1-ABC) superfamily)